MPRPEILPHTQRLLTSEQIVVGSLFSINGKGEPFYCSLYAPGTGPSVVLNHNSLYAYAEGETAEEAIYNARDQLWRGL